MVEAYLAKQGYALPGKEMRELQKLWLCWYRGFVEKIHTYKLYTGQDIVPCRRRVLGMAKVVCEDYGSLLVNEHVQITADGFEALNDVLKNNQFYTRMNRLAELTMALGTGAVVEFLDEENKPVIDYIRADKVYPLSWDNEDVAECAFASKKIVAKENGKTEEINYIQIHRKEKDGWRIRNVWLNSAGEEVELPAGMAEESPISPVPLFQIVRPNTVNTADLDSPLGASVYADALEQLADCDIVWDSYINEFVLGKKRILVPMSLSTIQTHKPGEDGSETLDPIFDPNDTLFYVYESDMAEKPIELDMNLRTAEHDTGLQRAIDMLSKKCGLGMGRYKVESNDIKTATEVISAKSDLYQSLKRHEKTFGDAIIGMVRALAWMMGKSPDLNVSVKFDDSIIEDEKSMLDRCVKMVTNGLMSRKQAIKRLEKVDDEKAAEYLAEIVSEERMAQEAAEKAMYDADTAGDL